MEKQNIHQTDEQLAQELLPVRMIMNIWCKQQKKL